MKKEKVVMKELDLPEVLPLPGTFIKIQETINGNGEQVSVTTTQVIGTESTNNESEDGKRKYQRYHSVYTKLGINLSYDLETNEWVRVIKHFNGKNTITRVYVFML